jgi:hypothetical protein
MSSLLEMLKKVLAAFKEATLRYKGGPLQKKIKKFGKRLEWGADKRGERIKKDSFFTYLGGYHEHTTRFDKQ